MSSKTTSGSPPGGRASTGRAWLAAALLLGALPVLLPLLRGELPGHPLSDLADHVQGSWWWGGEILGGRWPRELRGILHPDGGVVWYPDPLGALLALPFRWLGPYGSFAVAVLVQCELAVLSAWWLGRRVGRDPRVAFVAACVAGPSAYLAGLLHGGLTEYLGVWVLALFTGVQLDWVYRSRRPWAPPVVMGVAAFQSFYYGAFCGVLGLCLVLGPGGLREHARRLVRAVVAVGLGALATAPVLWLASSTLHDPASAITEISSPSWKQPRLPAVDLVGFLAPWDYYWPDTPSMGNPGILHVHSLGWIALALSVVGFGHPRARRLRWGALAWLVLSLGPVLTVAGSTVTVLGHPVWLPARLLYMPGSPFVSVHHPYRMVAATLPMLGVLAGLGALRLGRRGHWLGLAVVVEAMLLSPARFPPAGTDPRPPAVYGELPPGAVLDLPPDVNLPDRMYLLWSVGHGHPVPYGVNNWLSPSLKEDPEVRDLLDPLASRERMTNRDYPPREPPWRDPVDHGGLAGLGFTAVVVHDRWLEPSERTRVEEWLTERFGPRAGAGPGHSWWLVEPAGNTPGR